MQTITNTTALEKPLAWKLRKGESTPAVSVRRPAPPFLSLFLGAAACLIYLFPDWAAVLQYDRAAIAGGEAWRVLTGHWVHWSAEQLLWDTVVFVALGIYWERRGRGNFAACVLLGAAAASGAVWFFLPEMGEYRGLSGLDSALFLAIAVDLLRQNIRERDWLFLAVCALGILSFLGKVGFEAGTGGTLFAENAQSVHPVPLAHLAGGFVGAVFGWRKVEK